MMNLIHNDCLEAMKSIPSASIDMILADTPYQRTQNKWDTIIPFESMWAEINRIIKPNGAICLFADGMYMAQLMMSNSKM